MEELASYEELESYLTERLGDWLVSHIAHGCAGVETDRLNLLAAQQAWQILTRGGDSEMARAWFVGMNDDLYGEAPVSALRWGLTDEVLAAAHAYVAHDGMGL